MKQDLFNLLGDLLAWTALSLLALSVLGIGALGVIQGVYMVRHIKQTIRARKERVE